MGQYARLVSTRPGAQPFRDSAAIKALHLVHRMIDQSFRFCLGLQPGDLRIRGSQLRIDARRALCLSPAPTGAGQRHHQGAGGDVSGDEADQFSHRLTRDRCCASLRR